MFTVGLDFNISLKKSSIGLLFLRTLILKDIFTFIFGCTGSLFKMQLLFVAVHRLLIVASLAAGHGLLACRLQWLGLTGLVAPCHVGYSWTKD